MIKRTLYFGNPAYLSLRNAQLVIHLPDANGIDDRTGNNTFPIEDIGVVVLDHKQITITHGLLEALLANNSAVITCDSSRMPVGLLLPLSGNTATATTWKPGQLRIIGPICFRLFLFFVVDAKAFRPIIY